MNDYTPQALSTEAPITPELNARLAVDARAVHAIFGLQTEIGELVDSYKRTIFYNKEPDRTNIAEEIGDVFWYLAILCDHVNVSFEQCMRANIDKLRARYPNKFSEYDAVNRNLENERATLDDSLCARGDGDLEDQLDAALAAGDSKRSSGAPCGDSSCVRTR